MSLTRFMMVVLSLGLTFGVAEGVSRIVFRSDALTPSRAEYRSSFSGEGELDLVGEPGGQDRVRVPTPFGEREGVYMHTPSGVRLVPNVRAVIRNHRLSGRDIFIRTNALGYRDRPVGNKADDELRILVLGDSITLGDYVQEEETYPRALERHLQAVLREQRTVRTINAGVGSVGLKTEESVLLETGLSTAPEIVLIGLYLNDASESLQLLPLPGTWSQSRLFTWLHRRLFVVFQTASEQLSEHDRHAWASSFDGERNLARRRGPWWRDPVAFDAEIYAAQHDWGYAWAERAWEELSEVLLRIKALEPQYGFRLAVALFPVRHQVEAEFENTVPQRHFERLMRELEIPSFDLLPVLRAEWRRHGGPLYYDWCHLTPVANEMVGAALAEFVAGSVSTNDSR